MTDSRKTEGQEIEGIVRTRLRTLRHTLGLSLDDLAARTNLSPSTISRVETGKRTISLDILLPRATRDADVPRSGAQALGLIRPEYVHLFLPSRRC